MNNSFEKYKNLWIAINSQVEDQPQPIQNKFNLFEDPMFGSNDIIDYDGEYGDLLEFKNKHIDINQSNDYGGSTEELYDTFRRSHGTYIIHKKPMKWSYIKSWFKINNQKNVKLEDFFHMLKGDRNISVLLEAKLNQFNFKVRNDQFDSTDQDEWEELGYANYENMIIGEWLIKNVDGISIWNNSNKNPKTLEKNVRRYLKNNDIKGFPESDQDGGIDWVTWSDLVDEVNTNKKTNQSMNQGAGVPNKKFAATLMIPIDYSQDATDDENYFVFKDLKSDVLNCLPNDFTEISKHINHYNLSNGDYVLAEGSFSYLVAEEDDYANLNLMFVPNFNEEDFQEGDDTTYEDAMKDFKDEVNQAAEKLFKQFKGNIRTSKGGYTSGIYKGQPIAESITMNALDWGKTTEERNQNLDKFATLKTSEEKEEFKRNLKNKIGSSKNQSKNPEWLEKFEHEYGTAASYDRDKIVQKYINKYNTKHDRFLIQRAIDEIDEENGEPDTSERNSPAGWGMNQSKNPDIEKRIEKEKEWLEKYQNFIDEGTWPENEFNSEKEFYDDVEKTEDKIEYLKTKLNESNQQGFEDYYLEIKHREIDMVGRLIPNYIKFKWSQTNGLVLFSEGDYKMMKKILDENNISYNDYSLATRDFRLNQNQISNEQWLRIFKYVCVELKNDKTQLQSFKNDWESVDVEKTMDLKYVYGEILSDYGLDLEKLLNPILESQNQPNVNSPREYLNSLFGKRIDPKDYEKINNNVVSKFGSSVVNLFASTEGADKVDNAAKYQQYFKSNQKIMESKILNQSSDKKININKLTNLWSELYGEDLEVEYPGLYYELDAEFTLDKLCSMWDDMYGEDFASEYEGIYNILKTGKLQESSAKIEKEELIDNFYFMFKNQHKDKIEKKESIKYSDIKEWFASAYKSDEINFKEFYKKFRDDDSVKVVTESEEETFEDGEVQKIDQIFGTMKKIKDSISDASRKIDDFVESDSNIDKLACKLQEGLSAGYSNIDNLLDQLNVELGYKSKQKLVENFNKKGIPVFETDPMNLQIGNIVTNESGIVGKVFDIQENKVIYQSGSEIVTESNESVYLVESETDQVDPELEKKYAKDKNFVIENWNNIFDLFGIDDRLDQTLLVRNFDKLEGDNDDRPRYSIMYVLSDALDKSKILFNYRKLQQFFNR